EGALSTAFVTTFSRRIATEGDRSAWDLASKVATLALVFMSAVSLLGVVFAPVLIDILAPGFPAEKAELTVVLTRIMFPFILLVSLAALVMGMLNARHVFGPPAMASAFFNLGSIIGGGPFCYLLGPLPVRLGRRPDCLAEHCISPDAIAAGNFRCGRRNRDTSSGLAQRGSG